ncbi:MAG: DUF4080 domain-containing protein [Planctomyces sp.]
MPSIVLATLNARYTHSSFGLRCLFANMGELQGQTALIEFTINESRGEILAAILKLNPSVLGLGVYIWNVDVITRLVSDLRKVRPDLVIVLGGPEVSYETESQSIVQMADYVITGEADTAFRDLCRTLLTCSKSGLELTSERQNTVQVIPAELPKLGSLNLPYEHYSEEDIAHRVIYVEVSRGCPFTCEFCLSALEIPVRLFDLDSFLSAMKSLLNRGARQFKFVDRTFNLNLRVSQTILQFFLDHLRDGLFLHFEMIPDRLPDSLRDLIRLFPPGVLQFEIGVQTFNDDVGHLISRQQNNAILEDNFRFLRNHTGVHIHADLIVGLPGEDLASFASGFDRLRRLRPQEIQIGFLKRLKGTPIVRHDAEWQMVYSESPPFEILCNRLVSFDEIHQMKVFTRYWDLIANSGHFAMTLELLLDENESAFQQFQSFCNWIQDQHPGNQGIAFSRLFELVFDFLTTVRNREPQRIAESLWTDYCRNGRRDRPGFLRGFTLPSADALRSRPDYAGPERQKRHQPASSQHSGPSDGSD